MSFKLTQVPHFFLSFPYYENLLRCMYTEAQTCHILVIYSTHVTYLWMHICSFNSRSCFFFFLHTHKQAHVHSMRAQGKLAFSRPPPENGDWWKIQLSLSKSGLKQRLFALVTLIPSFSICLSVSDCHSLGSHFLFVLHFHSYFFISVNSLSLCHSWPFLFLQKHLTVSIW